MFINEKLLSCFKILLYLYSNHQIFIEKFRSSDKRIIYSYMQIDTSKLKI